MIIEWPTSKSRRSSQGVEVRGVEPRSEEKILLTSPYEVRRFVSRAETPPNRIHHPPAPVLPLPGFTLLPGTKRSANPPERRSSGRRWMSDLRTGCLMSIKQPVRSCSWHLMFFRFFSVDTETTVCSQERPHPRRSQVTPKLSCSVLNIRNRLFKLKYRQMRRLMLLDSRVSSG